LGAYSADLERAVSDCLLALASLNAELNGEVPSSSSPDDRQDLPRSLVYAVIEVARMLRASQDHATDTSAATRLGRAAWRIETAWSAVLAGDIDDLGEHLKHEEVARFQ
jgi:hypothetical protein